MGLADIERRVGLGDIAGYVCEDRNSMMAGGHGVAVVFTTRQPAWVMDTVTTSWSPSNPARPTTTALHVTSGTTGGKNYRSTPTLIARPFVAAFSLEPRENCSKHHTLFTLVAKFTNKISFAAGHIFFLIS